METGCKGGRLVSDNSFNGVIDSMMKGMSGFLSSKTVVGEATTIGDTTIIPLVDVTFGIGAGASTGDKKSGGAGAMSGKMMPSAVLVVKNGQIKLVNIKNQDGVTKVLDMIPDLVERFTTKKEEMPADEEVIEHAFPDEA